MVDKLLDKLIFVNNVIMEFIKVGEEGIIVVVKVFVYYLEI